MKRIMLYLNDTLAIRSIPMDEKDRAWRIESWKNVYGTNVRIEVSD